LNFFQQQELARRNTRMMVFLYVLAVIAVVLVVDVVIGIAYGWGMSEPGRPVSAPASLYVLGAAGTLAAILIASAFHILRLREGGAAIARLVGANRVSPDTRDPLERRLMNVVEEMAIAAGMRVPALYVMQEETGINAFAAGYDASSSIITVTWGTLHALNRDELQGVIGHEFSHIVNGDLGLNLRMMGVLGGILFIGSIGEFLMRGSGSGRGSKDSASGGIVVFGLALFAIGYIGVFFARLIKASVSRQREFLADAASVQFTRNPAGIAGALDQIRASTAGTRVMNRYAEDMSHMFFGQSVPMWLGGLFDTHPAVDERIRRVVPNFGATEYRRRRAVAQAIGTAEPAPGPLASAGKRAGDHAYAWGHSVAQSVALVGSLEADKVDHARRLIERIPASLREAVRVPNTAAAVVLGLLLAEPRAVMEQQLAAAAAAGAPALAEAARAVAGDAAGLSPALCLPLVDLALPALKSAPAQAKHQFLAALDAVIRADRRVSLHEFVILTLARSQLEPGPLPNARKSISELRAEVTLLLSLFAHAGRGSAAAAAQPEAAFGAGQQQLGMKEAVLAPLETLSLQAVGEALESLRALAPLAKSELMSAFFAAVISDKTVKIAEAELMRLAGAVLGCPLPPLIEETVPV
jgi:Zn-dependent protease with chaperone function